MLFKFSCLERLGFAASDFFCFWDALVDHRRHLSLQVIIAWINHILEKQDESSRISDLGIDLNDGTLQEMKFSVSAGLLMS
jgi:hypothetical protein